MPAVGTLCADPAAADLIQTYGQAAVAETLRLLLAEVREALGLKGQEAPDAAALLAEARCRLGARRQETLKRVINATGVVIHTNLGRAPLAPEAVLAMAEAAGYGNLEFDLETGRRASRHDHLTGLIGEVTGAEGGLVVNNCAGAVLLALSALAGGGPVIVSRGELVEIGGGFRVPDIVRQSGARLVEVGTTNRTHLSDYEQALREHPDAKIILRTHPSNFRIIGFTSAPSIADLAAFAHARGVLLVEDLGGGALVDLEPFGITGEPPVQDSVRDGADLVIFSGDKLLGGPQAGIVAGRTELLERLAHHPLARALRLDKLSLAALAATLRLYLPPNDPTQRVPVLRMLTQASAVVQARAEALKALIADDCGLTCSVLATSGYAGGGAMPMQALNSWGLCLDHSAGSAEDLARRLRTGPVPVIGRIERGQVILDLRTVADEALADLAEAIRLAALAPPLGGSDLPA